MGSRTLHLLCEPWRAPRSFSSWYDGADGADERERLARFQQFSATLPRDRDFSVPAVLPSAVSACAARRSRSVSLIQPTKLAPPSVIFASLSSVQPASGLKLLDRVRL